MTEVLRQAVVWTGNSSAEGATGDVTKHYAGCDIGGTKTLALVVSEHGEILHECRVARPHGPDETVEQLCDMVAQVEQSAGVQVDAVGVGIAGAIDREGSVRFSPNIPELVDFPLQALLTDRLGLPIVVDNDATAATWAEHRLGAGRDADDMLYIALGTGIGAGLVLNGAVYRGAHGFAGEVGHMVIDRHGDKHISDVRGPWEMYASGNGLGALARHWASTGRLTSVAEAVDNVDDIRGEHVSAALAAQDPQAFALLDAFAGDIAVGITNLLYVLDPALVVLGGGLVDLGEPLRSRVQHQVDETTLGGQFRPNVPILLAELGSRSAALGAAMLSSELATGAQPESSTN